MKAETQLENGKYDYDDLTNSILNGKVHKKERDEKKNSKYKYTIVGPALDGSILYSCGKVIQKEEYFYFIITFHEAK